MRLYDFDHKLRHLLSAVLESTEIAFRDRVAYTLAHAFGPLGYRDAIHFRNPDHHGQFLAKLQDAIRLGQEQFIAHHMAQYDGNFPVWVAVELLSFGTLSKLYKNMHNTQRATVASYYGSHESYLSTWIHAAVNLRNLCAHYDRLYNRHSSDVAKLGRDEIAAGVERGSLFASMLALRGVCPDRREWVSLVTGLQALIEEFCDVVELRYMGLPEDWRRRLLRP